MVQTPFSNSILLDIKTTLDISYISSLLKKKVGFESKSQLRWFWTQRWSRSGLCSVVQKYYVNKYRHGIAYMSQTFSAYFYFHQCLWRERRNKIYIKNSNNFYFQLKIVLELLNFAAWVSVNHKTRREKSHLSNWYGIPVHKTDISFETIWPEDFGKSKLLLLKFDTKLYCLSIFFLVYKLSAFFRPLWNKQLFSLSNSNIWYTHTHV